MKTPSWFVKHWLLSAIFAGAALCPLGSMNAQVSFKGLGIQSSGTIDVSDDGTISIATASGSAAEAAVARIRGLTAEAEIGQSYLGTVSRIVDFGAFVEIFPGTDGLLHISEIADRRVKDVRDELKEGQQILVKCIGKEGNKIKLSRKAVLRDEERKAEAANAGDSE